MKKQNDIMWSRQGKDMMLNLSDDECLEIIVCGKKMIIINNSRFQKIKEKLKRTNIRKMKKVLNLHCGLGGNRKYWKDVEVTAVEINEEIAEVYKTHFPHDKVIIGDAKEYLAKHYKDFDFIWVSPPCQSHSRMRMLASKRGSYDAVLPNLELYEFIIFLDKFFKGKWVVENVVPYYEPLIKPKGKLGRHLIWSNFDFEEIPMHDGLSNNERGTHEKGVFNLRGFKLKHRKDQLIRNCVQPELGEYLLKVALQ